MAKKLPIREFAGKVIQRLPSDFMQSNGFLPPADPLPEFRELTITDSTISACLDFIQLAISARIGEYCHKNEEIQDFIRLNFELIDGSLIDIYRNLLNCLWAGFSVLEIVTVFQGGKLYLHSLPEIPAESVFFHICQEKGALNYGQIDNIVQNYGLPNQIDIPPEKCIIMRNNIPGSISQSPYGESRIKCIYGIVKAKKYLEENWARTLAKYGSPIVKYKLANANQEVINPEYKPGSRAEEYITAEKAAEKQILRQEQLQGWIYEEGQEIDLLFPPAAIGDNFRSAVEYYNRMIMRGLLIPSLVMDNGDVGSYALGEKHFELWQMSIDSLLQNVTEVLLEQLIRPLIVYNFGPQENFGYFRTNETKEELRSWADIYSKITPLGVIDYARLSDVNTIRQNLGFDVFTEEEFSEILEAKRNV